MAVKTKQEMLDSLKVLFGNETSDNHLNFLQDFTDTYTDLETKAQGDGTDWKAKYEENDKQWREKMRDAFFSGEAPADPDKGKDPTAITDPLAPPEPLKFENLFSPKED